MMSIREQQVELTRRAILDAFAALAGETDGKVTVAAICERCGVSPATVYRHFPDRDALVHAAAHRDLEDVPDPHSWTLADLDAHLRSLWARLADDLAVTRQAIVTESGREMRRARFEGIHGPLSDAVRAAGIDPEVSHGAHLVAAACQATSVHAFLDLYDRQGLDVGTAVDTVMWTVRNLLVSAGIDPESLVLTDQHSTSGGQP